MFRYGGDEFAVISFDNAQAVKSKMEKINLKLKECKKEYTLQVSVGIFVNDSNNDEKKIFELADDALYIAKNSDKSNISIYKK